MFYSILWEFEQPSSDFHIWYHKLKNKNRKFNLITFLFIVAIQYTSIKNILHTHLYYNTQ